MNSLSKKSEKSFTHFLNGFLNACLLSLVLTILLIGSNMAVSRMLAFFA